jgi:hypothetical protein
MAMAAIELEVTELPEFYEDMWEIANAEENKKWRGNDIDLINIIHEGRYANAKMA